MARVYDDRRDARLGPPACSHRSLHSVIVVEEGGIEYEGWICDVCDTEFVPKVSEPLAQPSLTAPLPPTAKPRSLPKREGPPIDCGDWLE